MFKFDRKLILAAFLEKRWTIYELARRAQCGYRSAFRAVNGLPVGATVIAKIAAALDIDAVKFVVDPENNF